MTQESEEIIAKLLLCDKKTPVFTLEGQTKICKVVDIYDGDTCRVVFNHNGCINKWNCLLYTSPSPRDTG